MSKQAFFIQGDSLLLPEGVPDSRISEGLSFQFVKNFIEPEVFEIPAIDQPLSAINVVSVLPGTELPDNWKSIPVRQALAVLSAAALTSSGAANLSRLLRACHIVQWRIESRFCGTCGAENDDAEGQAQRHCPKCGRIEFPRISPAVLVVITDKENRILLAHNKRFKTGVYSHISGFNEAGETLEETVVREILEEINIEVKDITYIKSQAWPFPNSLMIGFKARYLSGTIRPDGGEIEDAQWFTKDNLPEIPGHGSLSRYLINCWLEDAL